MKISRLLILIILVLFASCASPGGNDLPESGNNSSPTIIKNEVQPPVQDQDEPIATSGPDCYTEGIHPIGESISDQFQAVTTYDEVMVWFCNGALFEDILNALTTEEITDVDADSILHMLAEGKSWDEIWLELGVTEE